MTLGVLVHSLQGYTSFYTIVDEDSKTIQINVNIGLYEEFI